jgi:hypothetical protein
VHVSSVPLVSCSFSVLISELLHVHCLVACSVFGIFVGSLSFLVLCLCAVAAAVTVFCSLSVLILRLKQLTIYGSVEVGLYGCGEEGDGYDGCDKGYSDNRFGIHSFFTSIFCL